MFHDEIMAALMKDRARELRRRAKAARKAGAGRRTR